MKRYLIIKMSSLGDVVHLLPSLTDVMAHRDDVCFDWVVEESLTDIPQWHPLVKQVIPIALRRWRKKPWAAWRNGEWQQFYQRLRTRQYTGIIDAQGLLKSSGVALLAKGPRVGLNRHSAREPLASLFYHQGYEIPKGEHAITRLRRLFAQYFNYAVPQQRPQFGIAQSALTPVSLKTDFYLFLHGTTWATKHWPLAHWIALAQKVVASGHALYLPWGHYAEKQRALNIRRAVGDAVEVLPALSLAEMTYVMAQAKGIVAVDTGLGHLGAALGRPMVSLYGPTHSGLTGALGPQSTYLSATRSCAPCLKRTCSQPSAGLQPPCFQAITPEQVWEQLNIMVARDESI